jgi:hypothetical protein
MTAYPLSKPTRRETAQAMATIHTMGSNSVLDFWISLSPHVRVSMCAIAALGIIFALAH